VRQCPRTGRCLRMQHKPPVLGRAVGPSTHVRTVGQAFHSAPISGIVVTAGSPVLADVPADLVAARRRGSGLWRGGAVWETAVVRSIPLRAAGRTRMLVTHRFALDDARGVSDRAHDRRGGVLKAVVLAQCGEASAGAIAGRAGVRV